MKARVKCFPGFARSRLRSGLQVQVPCCLLGIMDVKPLLIKAALIWTRCHECDSWLAPNVARIRDMVAVRN